ncbi:Cortactin-binding protein 2 [Lemmus lemmus]
MATDGASCEPDLSRALDDPAGATAEAAVWEAAFVSCKDLQRMEGLGAPHSLGQIPQLSRRMGPAELSLAWTPSPRVYHLQIPVQKKEFDVDTLSKSELRMLLSVMEGELEARDVVIEALRFGDQEQ